MVTLAKDNLSVAKIIHLYAKHLGEENNKTALDKETLLTLIDSDPAVTITDLSNVLLHYDKSANKKSISKWHSTYKQLLTSDTIGKLDKGGQQRLAALLFRAKDYFPTPEEYQNLESFFCTISLFRTSHIRAWAKIGSNRH